MLPIYRDARGRLHHRPDRRQAARSCRRSGAGFDYATMARAIAAEQPGLEVLVVDKQLPEGDPATLPPPPAAGDARRPRRCAGSSTRRAPPRTRRARATPTTPSGVGVRDDRRARDRAPSDRTAIVFPFTHIGGIGWLFTTLLTRLRARLRRGLRARRRPSRCSSATTSRSPAPAPRSTWRTSPRSAPSPTRRCSRRRGRSSVVARRSRRSCTTR